jgi:signal peptidase I
MRSSKKWFKKVVKALSLKDKDQTWGSFYLEMAILIIFILFIRGYVFQLFRVSGPSMCPTLNQFETGCEYGSGEFIFVNEFVYNFLHEPRRGDIIVFKEKELGKNLIKRVIGIPGDEVEVSEGNVYRINVGSEEKVKLIEPYLSTKNQGMTRASKKVFIVPEGKYLLFGDNRLESLDARLCYSHGCNEHNSAYINKEDIKGRAEFTIWPTRRKLESIDY